MRCPPTLFVLLMLGAPFFGGPLACAAQSEVQAPQAEVAEILPITQNATLSAAASNATLPAATPAKAAATPTVQPDVTPTKNATIKQNTSRRTSSPAPSAAAQPAAKAAAQGAAKRTPSQKQPAPGGNATQEKKSHTQNGTQGAAGEKEGWVVIEQGTRPVYAGIHGGTVPLTVLRASNGALFALAGETGSDFMNVLRGNTTGTGRGAAAQATQQEEAKKEQPTEEALQNQAESALPPDISQEHANKNAPGKEQNATMQTEGVQPPVPRQTDPAVNAPASTAAAPVPAEKMPSANAIVPQEETKQPPKDPMVAKLLGIPPPEADLVIASSDLAHRLKNANADLAPFGLTADLDDLEDEEHAPTPRQKPAATLPKLTLGSYKDVLQLR